MTNLLPSDWLEVPLGDVISIRNGYAFKSGEFTTEGIPLVRQSNLDNGIVNLHEAVFIPESYLKEYARFAITTGDLLIGMSGSIGEPSAYGYDFPALQNQRTVFVQFAEQDRFHRSFIRHFLSFVESELIAKGKGGAVQNVSGGDIEGLTLRLPPLNEQRRIVTKIEALMARSARVREALDAIPALLDRYRQSVLAAAFRGDLTAEWRAHTMGAEVEISECWKSSVVGNVAELVSGQTPKGIAEQVVGEGDVPWFKVADMNRAANQSEMIEFDSFLTKTQAKQLGLKVRPKGTVIFPKRGGAIATNKKRVLGCPAAFDLNIMGLIPKAVSSDYLWFWMLKVDLSKISGGSNVPQINNGDIAPLPIPVPPEEEQHEICRLLADTFASIGTLERAWKAASGHLPKLNQSILAKAFRGELVPQDPNDEPASALLARIKAERAANGSAPRGRRRKPASMPMV